MRRREFLRGLDEVSFNYIMTLTEASNQQPLQIIGEIVRRDIAARAATVKNKRAAMISVKLISVALIPIRLKP
ncbi:MAG: hypothetical protein LBQ55_10370 [Treponema sp.]|jgi:hypothetical protein|nr:hypothetical protein [Treponema sp.]